MKTHDFIKANIGQLVYVRPGPWAMSFKYEIRNKLPLKLIHLNRRGLALVENVETNEKFCIKPSALRLYSELTK